MPYARLPLRLPLAVLSDHELQIRIARRALATDPPVLQLGKVALEETNLVLPIHAWRIRVASHDAEMVPDLATVDRGGRLRDQLDTPHGLPIPVRGGVESELCPLLRDGVVRVLVRGREVNVLVYCTRPVNIVLVGTDLVRPRPIV